MLNRIVRFLRRRFPNENERAYRAVRQAWKSVDGDHTMRLQYPLNADSVVVDAGGYRGQWSSDIYAMYRCHIHVLEPIPDFADFIETRFSANSDITLHRVALGAFDGTSQFSSAADATGRHASGSPISVPVRAAVPFLRSQGIDSIDLLKLNIEGDEYDVIEHLGSEGMLPRIRFLQAQFHPFVPDAAGRLESAKLLLMKTHRPTYQYRYVWEGWERKL